MNFTHPNHSSFFRNKFCLLTDTIDSPLRISYNSWISQILSCSVWHVITISFSLFSYFPRNFRHLTPFPDAWRVTREERISSYYIRLLPRYKTDCLLAITFSFIHLFHGKCTFLTFPAKWNRKYSKYYDHGCRVLSWWRHNRLRLFNFKGMGCTQWRTANL